MTNDDRALMSRLTKGLGAQGYSQAVQIFIRLAEVPLLLGFWGTQLYGEWLMLAAIPAYLAIADMGFAGVASREMSMRSGRVTDPVRCQFKARCPMLLLVCCASDRSRWSLVNAPHDGLASRWTTPPSW
jgi:hypothetical protein